MSKLVVEDVPSAAVPITSEVEVAYASYKLMIKVEVLSKASRSDESVTGV
jgi:hypothetical protein